MSDANSIARVLAFCVPQEVYNLAAQSHVGISFENPVYTFDVNATGAMRLLESIRTLYGNGCRFYQASSSEIFGATPAPQDETSAHYPRSPYGAAKLAAYWVTLNYRESYGLHASNGILFNHESPIRGEHFVTRKVVRGLVRVKLGLQERVALGNLDASRDWGHARDYVEAMRLMLLQPSGGDYVIGTGEARTVRELVEATAELIDMQLHWVGHGLDEQARLPDGRTVVSVEAQYMRPAEVDTLRACADKARRVLNWQPKVNFKALVAEMVAAELAHGPA